MNVRQIKQLFRNKLHAGHIEDNGTIEILGASFEVDSTETFGNTSAEYAKNEHEWYMSQSLDVRDLKDTPKIWMEVAAKDFTINSNYGYLVFSAENGHQYEHVLDTLRKDINSRQAIMIYTRPSMHIEATMNGRYDFTCTNTVQYIVRNNKLCTFVNMRSSDFVFGFKYDVLWQKFIQEKLAKELGVEVGPMQWNAGSLHIYERHFYLVDHLYDGRKRLEMK